MHTMLFVLFLVRCLVEGKADGNSPRLPDSTPNQPSQDLPPFAPSPNNATSFPSSPLDPFQSSPNDALPFSSFPMDLFAASPNDAPAQDPFQSSLNDAPTFPSFSQDLFAASSNDAPQDPLQSSSIDDLLSQFFPADLLASSPNDAPPISSSLFDDTCDYTAPVQPFWKCGDSCIHEWGDCYCGISGQIESNQHCCIPPGSECFNVPGSKRCEQQGFCTEAASTSAKCSDGFVLPSSIPCNTTVASQKCPNTYSESLFLGNNVHYACPKMCIPEDDYCQGISWCGTDTAICGPELRCSKNKNASNLNSNLAPNHYYCDTENYKLNDHTFDKISRIDEQGFSQDGSALDIDETKFTSCYEGYGLDCGGNYFGASCFLYNQWCNKDSNSGEFFWSGICADGTNTDDWRLCSNPKVWENLICSGRRCTGNNMRCSTPWYTQESGKTGILEDEPEISDSCEDKSDQVLRPSLHQGRIQGFSWKVS